MVRELAVSAAVRSKSMQHRIHQRAYEVLLRCSQTSYPPGAKECCQMARGRERERDRERERESMLLDICARAESGLAPMELEMRAPNGQRVVEGRKYEKV